MRAALVSFILFLALVIGLPYGPFVVISQISQGLMEYIGSDVPMTPFTYDMPMITADAGERSLYTSEYKVLFHRSESTETYEMIFHQLDMHKFKLPLLLYLELFSYGFKSTEALHALCTYAQSYYPETDAIEIEISDYSNILKDMGYNVKHDCDF